MPKLIYASTKNRDLFYILKIDVSDPVFFVETDGKGYVFLDSREIDFFREKNPKRNIEAALLNPLLEEARKIEDKTNSSNKLALYLIEKFVKESGDIYVPTDFPLDMADFLRAKGIKLIPKSPLYPERAVKTPEEISIIKETIGKTLKVFQKIEKILKESRIDGECLKYKGETLTSEFLKKEASIEMAKQGIIDSEGLIISSGNQSAIPHHPGAGPIRANQPIVCDIFPRHREYGYYADITRTYAKGVPSKKLLKMFEAVCKAQERAIEKIKAGVPVREIHNTADATLKKLGFETKDNGGFVHSVGHGVGLEVHENPSLSPNSGEILAAGNVITIEPGLYYPEIGGIRLEDMVLVTETGAKNLVNYHKNFVIS